MEKVIEKNRLKDYLIGDKFFYRRALLIVLPLIVQNTITNVVSLLDNVMIGRVGTLEMSSVAIVNQLILVFNLCIFGALAGAGIFATQYAGAKDDEGIRNCFRIRLIICTVILIIAFFVFGFFVEPLVGSYLAEGTSPHDVRATLGFAKDYLNIILIGLVPFAVSLLYASALRELGETKLPMYASVVAIVVNVSLNYVLIFGALGFPALGVRGAAIATTISRFAEMLIVVIFAHKNRDKKYKFLKGVYRTMKIPSRVWAKVMRKGSPMLINEFLWGMGTAFYLQCYSVRGLEVVAAANIATTVNNLFNVVFVSIGSAVGVMVGHCLGANEIQNARLSVWRLITLSVTACAVIGGILALLSGLIPEMYNTEPIVKELAKKFLLIFAFTMPLHAFTHASYFTLRSGGKTIITFIFDSGFMWIVSVPVAYVLSHFTGMHIVYLYLIVNLLEIIKCILGFIFLKKEVWISNIVR